MSIHPTSLIPSSAEFPSASPHQGPARRPDPQQLTDEEKAEVEQLQKDLKYVKASLQPSPAPPPSNCLSFPLT